MVVLPGKGDLSRPHDIYCSQWETAVIQRKHILYWKVPGEIDRNYRVMITDNRFSKEAKGMGLEAQVRILALNKRDSLSLETRQNEIGIKLEALCKCVGKGSRHLTFTYIFRLNC